MLAAFERLQYVPFGGLHAPHYFHDNIDLGIAYNLPRICGQLRRIDLDRPRLIR
ncbi:hypothetical protein D3C80_1849010 [compost metagenome]